MPPKDAKKKKTAADKAKEEEEEARRIAEEEAKQEAIRQKEKEAEEQKAREQLAQVVEEEREKFIKENFEFDKISENRKADIIALRDHQRRQLEWAQFSACSRLPNLLSEKDLNSHLMLLDEPQSFDSGSASLEPLLKELPEYEELATQLEERICAASDSQDFDQVKRLQTHLQRLRSIIHNKWDGITAHILQHYDYIHKDMAQNFQLTHTTDGYVFCLWANITKNLRVKAVDFNANNMTFTIPKPIALANVAIRMIYESVSTASAMFEDQDGDVHRSIVGGVLHLDLVELPDSVKIVDKWAIRPILSPDNKLRRVNYPFKKPAQEGSDEPKDSSNNIGDDDPTPTTKLDDTSEYPLTIIFRTTPNAFIHTPSAQIMWWNEEKKTWSNDGITDVEIDKERGIVKFTTIHFRPTALVQSSFPEFPIKSWELTPTDPTRAELVVRGEDNQIKLEVGQGYVKLLEPTNEYLEEFVLNKKWAPSMLLKRLSQIGLNFRGPTSTKGTTGSNLFWKNPLVEKMLVGGISFGSPSVVFRGSPANVRCPMSKGMLQFKEWNSEHGTCMDDGIQGWHTLVFDVNYQTGRIVQEGEKQEEALTLGFAAPDMEVTENTRYPVDKNALHSTVYHTVYGVLKAEESKRKIQEGGPSFTKTVEEALTALKLISFSN